MISGLLADASRDPSGRRVVVTVHIGPVVREVDRPIDRRHRVTTGPQASPVGGGEQPQQPLAAGRPRTTALDGQFQHRLIARVVAVEHGAVATAILEGRPSQIGAVAGSEGVRYALGPGGPDGLQACLGRVEGLGRVARSSSGSALVSGSHEAG